MSYKRFSLKSNIALLVGWLALCCTSVATASFTFGVFPAYGPNGFGSPNFGQYGLNAIDALRGIAGYPTDYKTDATAYTPIPVNSDIEIRDFVSTTFPSYRGGAAPDPVWQGGANQFANERGNKVYFGFTYKNTFPYPTTGMIQLEDVIWETRYFYETGGATVNSNFVLDPLRSDFISTPGNPNYSPFRYGINYGIDRIPYNGDDVIVNSGTPDQLVDELYYVGVGEALQPVNPGANNLNTIQLLTEGWKQDTQYKGVSVEGCYYLDDLTTKLGCGSISLTMNGDFNNDGVYDCADVDALVADIVGMTNTPAYDLNGDNVVDTLDLTAWLSEAGEVQLGPGKTYLPGDVNLDGVVDGTDFGIWNANKFTVNPAWCSGDLNADGVVDGSDFGIWNMFKFQSSDSTASAVPEPSAVLLLLASLSIFGVRRFRRA